MKNMTADFLLASSAMYIRVKQAMLVLIAFFFFGSGGLASAQDILTLKSGKEIRANIIEEGTDVIKYREFDNPAGPLYSISKENIASIKYKKGDKSVQDTNVRETEKPVADGPSQPVTSGLLTAKKRNVYLYGDLQPSRSLKLLMEDQPEALRLYESGKTLYRLSNSCPLIILINSYIFSQSVNKKETSEEKIRAGIPGLVIDGGLIIAAIILSSSGKKKIRSSVDIYNASLNKPVSYKLDFGLQESGIGIALKF